MDSNKTKIIDKYFIGLILFINVNIFNNIYYIDVAVSIIVAV